MEDAGRYSGLEAPRSKTKSTCNDLEISVRNIISFINPQKESIHSSTRWKWFSGARASEIDGSLSRASRDYTAPPSDTALRQAPTVSLQFGALALFSDIIRP